MRVTFTCFNSLNVVQAREEALAKKVLITKYHAVENELLEFVKANSDHYLVDSDLNKFTVPALRQVLLYVRFSLAYIFYP